MTVRVEGSDTLDTMQVIVDTTLKMGLTPEDDFILRVVQLSELLAIRHCVFLMGPTGSGRSECYKVLAKAIQAGTDKPVNTYLEACNRKKVLLDSESFIMASPEHGKPSLCACPLHLCHSHLWNPFETSIHLMSEFSNGHTCAGVSYHL